MSICYLPIKGLDVGPQRQSTLVKVPQVEDFAAILRGKTQRASCLWKFACQHDREKGFCRDSGVCLVVRKLAILFGLPNEVLISDRCVKFSFGLRLPRSLIKTPDSSWAWAIRGKPKYRCCPDLAVVYRPGNVIL